MFVTVSTYRVKAGEEDAIIALHEDWQRHQQPRAKGYLSGELLRNVIDFREFIAIMRFENQETARALANDREQDAWYRRVVSLTENVPVLTGYTREWPDIDTYKPYSEQRRKTMSENPYASVTELEHIPDDLQVPPGNVLLLRAYGKGVQIYTCPDTTNAKPHAILLESDRDEGDLVAIHFAGPSWQATKDGSIVVGDTANKKHVEAPDRDGVDWLLLPAKSTTGNDGLFSKVTFIQRLYTDGGNAPAGSCDQKPKGTEILVEYSAQYFFYGPATGQQ